MTQTPFWIWVNLSDIQDSDKATHLTHFVWLYPGEKRWDPTNHFLYILDGVFNHGWYEFKLKCWCLSFFLQNSSARSCFKGSLMPSHFHISCSNYWKIGERNFLNSVSRFDFFVNFCRPFKMVKRDKFLRKKERNYYKKWTFAQKESSY